MPLKFSRNYKLLVDTVNATLNGFTGPTVPAAATSATTIDSSTSSIEITPPFTVEFNVTRTNQAPVNNATITVYNLALATRTLIRKDWPDTTYRPIELWAGYGDGLPTPEELIYGPNASVQSQRFFPRIFRGNVVRAYSFRQGNIVKTVLECQDGGYNSANATFAASYAAGTPYVQIIQDMINAMPFTNIGAIDDFPGSLLKGEAFSGDPNTLLRNLLTQFGGLFFIDNELGYALLPGSYVNLGNVQTISDNNGILGVPIKALGYVDVEMIFEPGVTIGQQINLKTTTVPYYNGQYTVCGISHKGLISGSICGDLVTKLTLNNLAANSVPVQPWSNAS